MVICVFLGLMWIVEFVLYCPYVYVVEVVLKVGCDGMYLWVSGCDGDVVSIFCDQCLDERVERCQLCRC